MDQRLLLWCLELRTIGCPNSYKNKKQGREYLKSCFSATKNSQSCHWLLRRNNSRRALSRKSLDAILPSVTKHNNNNNTGESRNLYFGESAFWKEQYLRLSIQSLWLLWFFPSLLVFWYNGNTTLQQWKCGTIYSWTELTVQSGRKRQEFGWWSLVDFSFLCRSLRCRTHKMRCVSDQSLLGSIGHLPVADLVSSLRCYRTRFSFADCVCHLDWMRVMLDSPTSSLVSFE